VDERLGDPFGQIGDGLFWVILDIQCLFNATSDPATAGISRSDLAFDVGCGLERRLPCDSPSQAADLIAMIWLTGTWLQGEAAMAIFD
jgi:hypothetical protein